MLVDEDRRAMSVHDGDTAEFDVPPTIQALLAARLDLLTRRSARSSSRPR